MFKVAVFRVLTYIKHANTLYLITGSNRYSFTYFVLYVIRYMPLQNVTILFHEYSLYLIYNLLDHLFT